MATSATIRNAYIVPNGDGRLLGAKVVKKLVANNQTLAKGDFVILSSGKVAIAKAAATAAADFASDVFGITQDAVANSGTGSTTYVNVQIINEDTRLIGNYCGTTTSAATGIALAATIPGANLVLYNMAGKWVFSPATAATEGIFVGVGIAPQDADGYPAGGSTINGGRIIVKVKSSVIE